MDCLPCQQRARAQAARGRNFVQLEGGRSLSSGPWVSRSVVLGQASSDTGPQLDMKRDLIAGGLAVGATVAYDRFAPKKWPKLTLISSVGMAVATYFVAVWGYRKLA